jgi:uncharacterized membrane protein HdeD (DUF308 family)
MMIGAACVPLFVILVLLLLRSQDGLSKAIAFASGQILVRLAQGLGLGSELAFSAVAQTKQGASAIVSTLVLVLGILLLITAFKSWAKEEDPDAPPARWMARVSSFSRLAAAAATFLYPGLTALILLTFIAVWSIVHGVAEIAGAILLRTEIDNEWLLILGGVVSVLFGVLILMRPGAGALALVWLISLFSIVFGVLQVAFSFRLRQHSHAIT